MPFLSGCASCVESDAAVVIDCDKPQPVPCGMPMPSPIATGSAAPVDGDVTLASITDTVPPWLTVNEKKRALSTASVPLKICVETVSWVGAVGDASLLHAAEAMHQTMSARAHTRGAVSEAARIMDAQS